MLRSPLRFWILATLLAANLVVGVLSLYFIRSVNERYAALFENGAPAIYNLRTLTREVTGVQRLARRITSPDHEPGWAELVPPMIEARERLDTRVHDVGTMAVFKGTPHPASIRSISGEYATHVQRFIQLVREGKLAEAMEFNLAVLRPCHDRFQQTLDLAADHIEEQGRNLRDRYAKDSRFFGGLSLAFASMPIVAVSVGALVMTALLGLLLLVVLNPRPDRRS
jgi:hypothetical protein